MSSPRITTAGLRFSSFVWRASLDVQFNDTRSRFRFGRYRRVVNRCMRIGFYVHYRYMITRNYCTQRPRLSSTSTHVFIFSCTDISKCRHTAYCHSRWCRAVQRPAVASIHCRRRCRCWLVCSSLCGLPVRVGLLGRSGRHHVYHAHIKVRYCCIAFSRLHSRFVSSC